MSQYIMILKILNNGSHFKKQEEQEETEEEGDKEGR